MAWPSLGLGGEVLSKACHFSAQNSPVVSLFIPNNSQRPSEAFWGHTSLQFCLYYPCLVHSSLATMLSLCEPASLWLSGPLHLLYLSVLSQVPARLTLSPPLNLQVTSMNPFLVKPPKPHPTDISCLPSLLIIFLQNIYHYLFSLGFTFHVLSLPSFRIKALRGACVAQSIASCFPYVSITNKSRDLRQLSLSTGS